MTVEIKDPSNTVILTGDAVMHMVKTPPLSAARICPQCHELTWRKTLICMWCGHDRLRTAYAVCTLGLMALLLASSAAHLMVHH